MKNIIITGTGKGIAYELALLFADAGHQVLAISRSTPKQLIDHKNITCLSVDLSETDNYSPIENFLLTWKTVDALINNAGTLVVKPFSETTTADFEKIYKVNV